MPADRNAPSPLPQDSGSKVSEKSTKSELWTAYNQLVAQLEGRASESSPETQAALAHDPSRVLAELKLKISQQLDALSEEVQADIANLADARRAVSLERRRHLEAGSTEQQHLSVEMDKVRQHWEQEQQEQLKTRQREEDDYRYNLQKARRSEEDAYNQKHTARETALREKEQALAEREKNVNQLETELAAWPKRLEDAVATARAELGKETGQQHAAETRELKLIHQHEVALATIKAQGLEQQLKGHAAEIDSLKRQLADASRQLKDMAVTVIEARSGDYRAVPDKQTTVDSGRSE